MNRRRGQSPGGWAECVKLLIVNELGYEVRLEVVLEAVYAGTVFN